ncbi:MAG: hypothetical protein ACI9G1_005222 [Pirellulaceae bacterium]|jgi:hypothetical protein
MSDSTSKPKPDSLPNNSTREFQFRSVHMMYLFALLCASLATVGVAGITIVFFVGLFWAFVFFSRSNRQACFRIGLLFLLSCLCVCGLPAVQNAREVSRRTACRNNLRQISGACQSYLDEHGSFPPAYIADKSGKPKHSWRVLILPYLGYGRLHELYNFDEPWDGPNNRKLISLMPNVYRCPGPAGTAATSSPNYFAVVGQNTAWPGARGAKMSEFPDGTSNTILLIESSNPQVAWTEPTDFSLDDALDFLSDVEHGAPVGHLSEDFFRIYCGGTHVVMADASGQYIDYGPTRQRWSQLLVRNDGGRLDAQLESNGHTHQVHVVSYKYGNCFRFALLMLIVFLPTPWAWKKAVRRTWDEA